MALRHTLGRDSGLDTSRLSASLRVGGETLRAGRSTGQARSPGPTYSATSPASTPPRFSRTPSLISRFPPRKPGELGALCDWQALRLGWRAVASGGQRHFRARLALRGASVGGPAARQGAQRSGQPARTGGDSARAIDWEGAGTARRCARVIMQRPMRVWRRAKFDECHSGPTDEAAEQATGALPGRALGSLDGPENPVRDGVDDLGRHMSRISIFLGSALSLAGGEEVVQIGKAEQRHAGAVREARLP